MFLLSQRVVKNAYGALIDFEIAKKYMDDEVLSDIAEYLEEYGPTLTDQHYFDDYADSHESFYEEPWILNLFDPLAFPKHGAEAVIALGADAAFQRARDFPNG